MRFRRFVTAKIKALKIATPAQFYGVVQPIALE
jgi:hypothetical protein